MDILLFEFSKVIGSRGGNGKHEPRRGSNAMHKRIAWEFIGIIFYFTDMFLEALIGVGGLANIDFFGIV